MTPSGACTVLSWVERGRWENSSNHSQFEYGLLEESHHGRSAAHDEDYGPESGVERQVLRTELGPSTGEQERRQAGDPLRRKDDDFWVM